jgi:hypothetical protein
MKRIISVLTVMAMMAAVAAPSFAARTAACDGLTHSFDGGAGGVSNAGNANENSKLEQEINFFKC